MTEAQTFEFELVSPERKLMAEPARMVVIPGEEGEFGVLPNHSALMASIRPGVVEAHLRENDDPVRIFIAGGFADVTATNCTILAEEAVNVDDLDQVDLEQNVRNLTEDLGMVEGDADKSRVENKLNLAKARLDAVTGSLSA